MPSIAVNQRSIGRAIRQMLRGLIFGDEPMTSAMQSSVNGFAVQVASELRSGKMRESVVNEANYPPGIMKAAKAMAKKSGESGDWEKYAKNMMQMQKGTDVKESKIPPQFLSRQPSKDKDEEEDDMSEQVQILEAAIRQQRRQCLNFDNGSHMIVEFLPVTKRFHLGERHDAFDPTGYDSAAQAIEVAEQHRGAKVIQVARA